MCSKTHTHAQTHAFCLLILTPNDYIINGMGHLFDKKEADNPINS